MAKKILVIDDEPEMVDMLRIRLEDEGYGIITALNGEEGLKKAEGERPDLVLLDILLPGMSGLEVAKRLRESKATKNIPIIMVTALIGGDAMRTGLKSGAAYFISKPFDPEELLTQIKSAIGDK
jgi:DNA-binding response OmpR family regulator